jgi:hypothetical protein
MLHCQNVYFLDTALGGLLLKFQRAVMHDAGFKGTVARDFLPCFLPVWIRLGLNVNCFWFLNFNNVPSVLNNYLKF